MSKYDLIFSILKSIINTDAHFIDMVWLIKDKKSHT